jgi:hypothetical protein
MVLALLVLLIQEELMQEHVVLIPVMPTKFLRLMVIALLADLILEELILEHVVLIPVIADKFLLSREHVLFALGFR